MVMCLLLTDGGLRNVLATIIDDPRMASFHDACAGAANTNRCSALVAGSSRLVSMEYIRMILM